MNHPTIYDVSRLSGVSIATVSRTFSDPSRVRESTRRRVYAAASALNYQPSEIARAMARQQTDKLAFILCKKGATLLDEFYAGICEGVMRGANSMEYQLLVSTAEDWQRTPRSKQIEGAILAGDAQPGLIAELQQQNVHVVLVNHIAPGFDLPCIVADEQGGVQQALEHLISRGHRRIAMLAGRFSSYITSERYNAFLSSAKQLGLSLEETSVTMCDRDIESATQAALGLLDRPDRPPAVFAFNDVLAAGVMNTHSSVADGRQEIFTAHAALCGAGRDTLEGLMQSISVDACIELLDREHLREPVLARIESEIEKRLALRLRGRGHVEFILFTAKYGILAQSPGAMALCERLRESK